MTAARQRLGAAGEQRAADWYVEHGFEIVARNWRCREGEIDLIVSKGRMLVFVEVKTRRSSAFGHPVEAVTRPKQAKIRKVAMRFCDEHRHRPSRYRFDVVSILAGDLEVYADAF